MIGSHGVITKTPAAANSRHRIKEHVLIFNLKHSTAAYIATHPEWNNSCSLSGCLSGSFSSVRIRAYFLLQTHCMVQVLIGFLNQIHLRLKQWPVLRFTVKLIWYLDCSLQNILFKSTTWLASCATCPKISFNFVFKYFHTACILTMSRKCLIHSLSSENYNCPYSIYTVPLLMNTISYSKSK